MKYNIANKRLIEYNLDKLIAKYIETNAGIKPIILMNSKTKLILYDNIKQNMKDLEPYITYKGYRVFIDPFQEYGDVELR